MGKATTEFRNRIVLIFDFDGTLAPNTIDFFLESHGVDPTTFKQEQVAPLKQQGWDSQLANFFALLQVADQKNLRKSDFEQLSKKFEPFEGVLSMFDQVREKAAQIVPDIEVDFFLVTCGFLDLLRPMPIFKNFKDAWGCELHFDQQEKPVFIKKSVTHPDKVRYILQIVKGLKEENMDLPSDVYEEIPMKDWYVPFDQAIYVGDGKSDMPAFSLMKERNGMAIAIVNQDEVSAWQGYDSMHTRRKVENLALADYHEESELMQSLLLATESIAKRVKLRRLGKDE